MSTIEGLWQSWRIATGRGGVPLSPEMVEHFLADVPLGPARLRQLRTYLGTDDPAAGVGQETDWDGLIGRCVINSPVADAATGGLWGRRDAFVLALGEAGFTRGQVRELDPEDVDPAEHTVAGVIMPWRDDPRLCRACVLRRWLQLCARLPPHGGRQSARSWLATRADTGREHDCQRDVASVGTWWQVYSLVPSIDQHGWASMGPVSRRTVTDIWNRHRPEIDTDDTPWWCPRGVDRQQLLGEIETLLDQLEDELDKTAGLFDDI